MIVSEESRIAAAQSYIDALVSHDGDSVPFAARCTRVEQGIKNGFSGNHLRRSLNRGAQYRFLADTTPPDYRIEGDRVHAAYTVLTKAAFGGRRLAARVSETFAIPAETPSGAAEIQHIKVRFQPFVQQRR
ncbi:hypothetical protein [Mycobacterium paraseoulense]|uniref:DUF8021 domain-containing protein n=1 Tax=Mycobacterium paraseoulense TaxID=590652 RepID=A0A1X0I3M3_9MYCO|nr:hypothetical protein [Mycobacterium paraseoulense]MCV7395792.1 hypothetical protein [Mycobacterium paraseoulense]ORB33593.1 hypothetical protein BST39_25880 [Mycobacterium paraseoulense]BBZ72188.1 hypothetical protein MPRS_32810 [Mycobacterium paraseoulense]